MTIALRVHRAALRLSVAALVAAIPLTGCSAGAGTLVAAPGVSDQAATARPTPSPLPTPAPTPTPAPAAIQIGAPTFVPATGSGTCSSGLAFLSASGTVATLQLTETGYAGAFAIASNSSPAVAGAAVVGDTLTITALSAGSTTIAVAGAPGAQPASCSVGVTITAGTVE